VNPRSLAGSGATALPVVLVVAMLVGQPIVLGFVLTGSMDAELANMAPGDGFIAVPPAIVGDVSEGDVVTFETQELQGGGLTTYRIVDETDQGYTTRGDANPFTDQDGPVPPVQESQIKAVALELGGDVVVIPRIGQVVLALQAGFTAAASAFSGIPGLGGLTEGNVGSSMVLVGLLLLGYSLVAWGSAERTAGPVTTTARATDGAR
jgi:signal peptidase